MTTPHPSAVRAAKALHIHNEQAVLTAAEFIDRETGVGELVAALEQIKMTCEVHSWADWSGYSDSHLEFMIRNEPDRGIQKMAICALAARQALARHHQRSQPAHADGKE